MSFLKGRVKALGAVASVVLSATLFGSSLIYASMTNNYKSWKQTGSSWSSMTMGTNGGTVAKYGCAVTSSAMLMVKSGAVTDSDFNPGILVEFLNENGGFSADGDLNWSALAYYAPDFKFEGRLNLYGTDEQKIQRVQQLLADGCSVVAQVKYGAHFVAVDSVKGEEIMMLDPGSQGTSLNETYGVASMNSLRIFRTTNSKNYQNSDDSGSSAAQNSVQTSVQHADAPETAPKIVSEVPTTAPAVESSTVPATMPETAPATTVADTETVASQMTELSETSKSTEVFIQTAPAVDTTEVTTTTTKPETMHEVVIITKAPTSTTEETTCTMTTAQTEILIDPIVENPESPENSENSVNPDSPNQNIQDVQESEQNLDNIQIILLETAPETAPGAPATNPTEETVPVCVPEDQMESVLGQIKEKDLYITVRFYILKDLDLLSEPDGISATLQTVPAGTCLDVVEVDEEFRWGKVRYEGQEGWISLRSANLTPSN
ncbi:MAG: hypothetical protein K2G25_05075 [Oscillospiraceae bacterium]|nr:hypothetical protein [Oscillospiraceae bacterium]